MHIFTFEFQYEYSASGKANNIEYKGMWNSAENPIQYIVNLNEALQQLVS